MASLPEGWTVVTGSTNESDQYYLNLETGIISIIHPSKIQSKLPRIVKENDLISVQTNSIKSTSAIGSHSAHSVGSVSTVKLAPKSYKRKVDLSIPGQSHSVLPNSERNGLHGKTSNMNSNHSEKQTYQGSSSSGFNYKSAPGLEYNNAARQLFRYNGLTYVSNQDNLKYISKGDDCLLR
jgi:hypothetical protein